MNKVIEDKCDWHKMKCDWQMNCLEKNSSKRSKETETVLTSSIWGHLSGTHGGDGERGEIALAKTCEYGASGEP